MKLFCCHCDKWIWASRPGLPEDWKTDEAGRPVCGDCQRRADRSAPDGTSGRTFTCADCNIEITTDAAGLIGTDSVPFGWSKKDLRGDCASTRMPLCPDCGEYHTEKFGCKMSEVD